MIPASTLQNGDVVLFQRKEHIGFFQFAIRLVQGNKFVHVGVIEDVGFCKLILEQVSLRVYSPVPLYRPLIGEVTYAFRPKFQAPPASYELINHRNYGYSLIVDSLVNHLMRRLTFGKWKFRPMLSKFSTNLDCSALVATQLQLDKNTTWCSDTRIIEPDDFSLHPDTFESLGTIDWTK